MRAKLKILLCAVFVFGLVVSQANAEGFNIGVRKSSVVQYGTNQVMGEVQLTYSSNVNTDISLPSVDSNGNRTISLTYDNLPLYGTAVLGCTGNFGNCSDVTATVEDNTVTVTIAGSIGAGSITVSNVRADVSALDADDTVSATVTSSAGDFTPIGGGGDSATGVVSTVKAGLVVEVARSSKLVCVDADEETDPKITVKEGFEGAWVEDVTIGSTTESSTRIRIQVSGVPSGVTFIWPGQDHDDAKPEPTFMYDHDDDEDTAEEVGGTLEFIDSGSNFVVYEATGLHDTGEKAFDVLPTLSIGDTAGGVVTVQAQLWPELNKENTILAFTHPLITDADDGSEFLNVTDCVTYLLFPFLTCGATEGWTTGISIANTSSDDGVFGFNEGADAQSGSITIWGFPKSEQSADGSSGTVPDSVMVQVTPNLAAGDSISFSCDATMPGFEGYAIARAGFQHAHGAAFVLGDFQDGAAFDVAHGYLALVLPDPEAKGIGRSADAAGGEGLSQ